MPSCSCTWGTWPSSNSATRRTRSRTTWAAAGQVGGRSPAVAALQRTCLLYPPIPKARAGHRLLPLLRVHSPDDGSTHRCPPAAAPGGHGHRQTAQPGGSEPTPSGRDCWPADVHRIGDVTGRQDASFGYDNTTPPSESPVSGTSVFF